MGDKCCSFTSEAKIFIPGFLTIGLSTVPRVGASYLLETIGSLLEAMQEIEKREVVIVIFFSPKRIS